MYSIVITVYNTDQSLVELTDRLREVFDQIREKFEILFIVDGSTNPNTWPTLAGFKFTKIDLEI